MSRVFLPSPRSGRLPLPYSRPVSAPSHSGLFSPLSQRAKIYTGKDLKHQLPVFERIRVSAAVARARRLDEEAYLSLRPGNRDLGKSSSGHASLSPLPPRGILKNSVVPASNAAGRRVHFGGKTVHAVSRWMVPDPHRARREAKNRRIARRESSSAAAPPEPAIPGSFPEESDKDFDESASHPDNGWGIGRVFLGSAIVAVVGVLALVRYDLL
ncbi:hypothetical protein N7523_010415 [Penicillium sp. IBT 18751x]|nr:hypothetical protein N7523_010415 [Penicillium sp. IBT 18751x]